MAMIVVAGAGVGVGWMQGVWSPVGAAQGTRVTIVDADPNAQQWHYEPVDLTVKTGSTIVWHNGGGQEHTVTADDNSFDSGTKAPGADWQWKAAKPGDYAYHCTPHPWMKAKIRVTR